MKRLLVVAVAIFVCGQLSAKENCTPANKKAVCTQDSVKKTVEWACKLVEEKGKAAVAEIKAKRFDCCGELDYVWINDMHPKMIMHPIKPMLDGTDLSENKDPKGTKLFVEFVNAVKKDPSGAWVPYMWTKMGEKDPTEKESWVQKCKVGTEDLYWVVGSGTWK